MKKSPIAKKTQFPAPSQRKNGMTRTSFNRLQHGYLKRRGLPARKRDLVLTLRKSHGCVGDYVTFDDRLRRF